jgi:hypothetical protein
MIKMLGLAGIAAIAAMAFLGAGTASATTLCKTSAGAGKCGSVYGVGTKISASSTEATLVTSLGTVVCKKSTVSGKTTSAGGAGLPVNGSVEALTFSECKLGSTSCTVSAVHLNYTASVAWTSGDNGTFTVGKGTGGAPGAHVVCGAFIDCTFTGEGIQLDVDGGSPALVLAKAEPLARESGGFLCPSSSTWTATYTVTAPNPLFVAAS